MSGAHVQQGLVRGQSLGPVVKPIESKPCGLLARRSWSGEQVGVWERVLKMRNIKS
jgi:hypothetical protein